MKETNAILKAEGPGQAKWDGSAEGYAVQVTAENRADIETRLGKVAAFYNEQTLVPPRHGMPGLTKLSPADEALLKSATPAAYAQDETMSRFIEAKSRDIETAFTAEDRKALVQHKPGEAIQSERLSTLPRETIDKLAEIVQHTRAVQQQGLSQKLELAQAQVQTQQAGLSR